MKVKEIKRWLTYLDDDAEVYRDHGCLTCGEAEGDLEIEPLPEDPVPPDALYDIPTCPLHWLARVAGKLYLVPAMGNGWAHRTPYAGVCPVIAHFPRVSLKYAMGCNIPWAALEDHV